MNLVFAIIAAVVSAGVFLVSSSVLWAALACGVTALAAASAGGTRRARIIWFNAGAVALIIAAAEGFLSLADEGDRRQTYDPPTFVIKEPDLGHRAIPNSRVHARLEVGGEQRYDVIYTINEHGLRISPPENADDPDDCALFFGCSFTFGEGLNDQQTMPFVAGVVAGGRYRIRNFGFLGYGPHHMLAAIDTGWVEKAADCKPKYAIYWAFDHHVIRAAGKWAWDDNGPRYVLQSDGSVRRDGNFGPAESILKDTADASLLARRFRQPPTMSVEDLELYLAIIRASRDRLMELYPGIRFHVILWDKGGEQEVFIKRWQQDGIPLHWLSKILPQWENRDWLYQQPHDVHPNAAAADLVARYVAQDIFE